MSAALQRARRTSSRGTPERQNEQPQKRKFVDKIDWKINGLGGGGGKKKTPGDRFFATTPCYPHRFSRPFRSTIRRAGVARFCLKVKQTTCDAIYNKQCEERKQHNAGWMGRGCWPKLTGTGCLAGWAKTISKHKDDNTQITQPKLQTVWPTTCHS